MKKFIIAAVAVTSTLFANAQADTKTQETAQTTVTANPDKVQIKVEELPASVQTALKAEAFQGWTPKTAYIVKADKPYYEVELTNTEAKATVVKFNEDGTVIN